jgi:hypothetical protein
VKINNLDTCCEEVGRRREDYENELCGWNSSVEIKL